MITLYSGTPGSGKSLKAAERIYNIMKYQKRLVIANFAIDQTIFKNTKSEYIYLDNSKITPEKLQAESVRWFNGEGHRFKEGAILLILDECQLIFNAREWQQAGRAQWLSFFTQHRKMGIDIILIAQFDRMIDRQIRSLIEYEYIHRKCSNFGWKGKLISLFFGGNLFVQVKMWYPLKERIGSEFFRAKKCYYKIYDTYDMFDTESEVPASAPSQLPDQDKPAAGSFFVSDQAVEQEPDQEIPVAKVLFAEEYNIQ